MDSIPLFFSTEGLARVSPAAFWIVFVLSTLGSSVSFFFLWRYLHRKRLMEDTPTSKIRSLAQGYVEVVGWGKQLPDHVTYAPLSALPCLWYRFKVEKYEQKSNNKGGWKVVSKGISDQNFILDDGTGQCIVDPEGAEVTPSLCDVWMGDTANPQAAKKQLAGGLGAILLAGNSRYRYTEERVITDDYLYLLAYHETLGGGRITFDHNGAVRDLIAEWKRDYRSMLERFDADNDGKIDMQEWEQVRTAARQEADKIKVEEDTSTSLHMVVRPPDRRKPFVISTRTEEDLIQGMGRRAVAGLAGFLILGGYAAFLLSARVVG